MQFITSATEWLHFLSLCLNPERDKCWCFPAPVTTYIKVFTAPFGWTSETFLIWEPHNLAFRTHWPHLVGISYGKHCDRDVYTCFDQIILRKYNLRIMNADLCKTMDDSLFSNKLTNLVHDYIVCWKQKQPVDLYMIHQIYWLLCNCPLKIFKLTLTTIRITP